MLEELLSIIQRLRNECPWDREQTHASLRPMLIEEAYETVEAIDHAVDTGDYTELKKELGDLLLHILFHSDLAREEGQFTIENVIQSECEKLIYRHPHVFGNIKAETPEQVSRNWEQLKRREKGRNSILDGVPASLPALQRAQRIQERASKAGFDWPKEEGNPGAAPVTPQGVWKKIREEIDELEEAWGAESGIRSPASEIRSSESGVLEPKLGAPRPIESDSESGLQTTDSGVRSQNTGPQTPVPGSREDEFGDLFFSLVNLARHEGMDAEAVMREATRKFERRFRYVEKTAENSGRAMTEHSLEELDALWNAAKREV